MKLDSLNFQQKKGETFLKSGAFLNHHGKRFNIADMNGKVFVEGACCYGCFAIDNYFGVFREGKGWSLYNKKGRIMPGAHHARDVHVYDDGSYRVTLDDGTDKYFDNGAKLKQITKVLAYFATAYAIIYGLNSYFNNDLPKGPQSENLQIKKTNDENQNDATFLGTVSVNGVHCLYFYTDHDPRTAEYVGEVTTDLAAIFYMNMDKEEKLKVGQWREKGFNLWPIPQKTK